MDSFGLCEVTPLPPKCIFCTLEATPCHFPHFELRDLHFGRKLRFTDTDIAIDMPFCSIKQIFRRPKPINLLKPYGNLPSFPTLTLPRFALANIFIQALNRIFLFIAHMPFTIMGTL